MKFTILCSERCLIENKLAKRVKTSPKHMFRICTEYKKFVFKDSIMPPTLLLHKQLMHYLNFLSSRNPISLVLLPPNKAHESYGVLFRRQCNIYAKRK